MMYEDIKEGAMVYMEDPQSVGIISNHNFFTVTAEHSPTNALTIDNRWIITEEDYDKGHFKIIPSTTNSQEVVTNPPTPLDTQVGGGHYKDFAIQPIEFIFKNGLGYCEANVIKYVTRWKGKNGIQDLEKAKHYIDLLIQLETENGTFSTTG